MKRRLTIAGALLGLVGAFLITGTASAQSQFELIPPVLADILVRIGVLLDGVLGSWVSGNDLTNSAGQDFVTSLG